jgi:hypothetical protein
MLTMFHAPNSRSSRLYWLNEELGRPARVELVGVRRAMTQTGAPDPRNPHPEGKVPFLIHDGVAVWESTAIALYLTELFPEAGLGIAPGTPQRGRFLAWLAWYGAVLEPVIIAQLCGCWHIRPLPGPRTCCLPIRSSAPGWNGVTRARRRRQPALLTQRTCRPPLRACPTKVESGFVARQATNQEARVCLALLSAPDRL